MERAYGEDFESFKSECSNVSASILGKRPRADMMMFQNEMIREKDLKQSRIEQQDKELERQRQKVRTLKAKMKQLKQKNKKEKAQFELTIETKNTELS